MFHYYNLKKKTHFYTFNCMYMGITIFLSILNTILMVFNLDFFLSLQFFTLLFIIYSIIAAYEHYLYLEDNGEKMYSLGVSIINSAIGVMNFIILFAWELSNLHVVLSIITVGLSISNFYYSLVNSLKGLSIAIISGISIIILTSLFPVQLIVASSLIGNGKIIMLGFIALIVVSIAILCIYGFMRMRGKKEIAKQIITKGNKKSDFIEYVILTVAFVIFLVLLNGILYTLMYGILVIFVIMVFISKNDENPPYLIWIMGIVFTLILVFT